MILIKGYAEEVGAWLFRQAKASPFPFDDAVGVADDQGRMCGGFMLSGWDGRTLEAHYWGPRTLKAGIVRAIFRTALEKFDAEAVIVKASKEHMARGCRKLGAEFTPNSEFGVWRFPRHRIEALSGTKEN